MFGVNNAARGPGELRALLENGLDRVLQALGLEMGTIWLHPHRVTRGLPPEAVEIGEIAAEADLRIPQVQAVSDWQKVKETHPELAPLAGVMKNLGIRASIAVSLEREGRAGGLAVHAPRPRVWTGTEIALVETAANLLAVTIETLRVEEERRRLSRTLKVLGRCNEAVVGATDEAVLLQEICRLVVEEGGYRLAWVGFAEEDPANTVRPVAQTGFEEGYLETVTITYDDSEHGRGPTGTAIRTGQPAVVRNILTDSAYAPWREEATRRGYASSIALPLIAGERRIGALNIYAAEPDAFAPDEVELLCRLADNLAFGIQSLRARTALRESETKYRALDVTERKQMEEKIRCQAARAEALLSVASRLNAQLDLDRVLKVVCEEARAAFHVPMAIVLLHDDRRDVLELAAGAGLPSEFAERLKPLPRSLFGAYVREENPVVIITDLRTIPDQQVANLCDDYNLRTGIGAMLQRNGRLIGVLALITTGEVRHFTAGELALLQGLADHASQAITNARLFAETQRRLKLVQALRNIDLAIAGSLDLRVTFSVVLDEITAQLGMDAAAILLFNHHILTLEYAAWRGFRTETIKRLRLRLGEGYAGQVALERRTIHIPFLPEAKRDPVQAQLLVDEGFVVYYGVPLIAKGQIQGVLEVCHRSPANHDGEWLQFLETLAGQAAIAIENVALLDQVQRSHLELVMAYDATIEGWARALELRDRETEGHSQRVTEMTLRLARALGMKEEELVHVRRGLFCTISGNWVFPTASCSNPVRFHRRIGRSCASTRGTLTRCFLPLPTSVRR